MELDQYRSNWILISNKGYHVDTRRCNCFLVYVFYSGFKCLLLDNIYKILLSREMILWLSRPDIPKECLLSPDHHHPKHVEQDYWDVETSSHCFWLPLLGSRKGRGCFAIKRSYDLTPTSYYCSTYVHDYRSWREHVQPHSPLHNFFFVNASIVILLCESTFKCQRSFSVTTSAVYINSFVCYYYMRESERHTHQWRSSPPPLEVPSFVILYEASISFLFIFWHGISSLKKKKMRREEDTRASRRVPLLHWVRIRSNGLHFFSSSSSLQA